MGVIAEICFNQTLVHTRDFGAGFCSFRPLAVETVEKKTEKPRPKDACIFCIELWYAPKRMVPQISDDIKNCNCNDLRSKDLETDYAVAPTELCRIQMGLHLRLIVLRPIIANLQFPHFSCGRLSLDPYFSCGKKETMVNHYANL